MDPSSQLHQLATESRGALLLPPSPENSSLDSDLYQRYSAAAQLLARLLTGLTTPIRILELGSNYLHPLPRFLDPNCVHITRADVARTFDDADFVLLEQDLPLPFENDAFDAVVALEVLEHMPADRRTPFVAECCRVARHGVVLSAPNGSPEVVAAETSASASFHKRNGREHPYLREHRDFGLPSEEEVRTILSQFNLPYAVLDNAPLERWLPMLLLAENLLERQAPTEIQQRVNEALNRLPQSARRFPYRKIYTIGKSAHATTVVSALNTTSDPSESVDRLPETVRALHMMATVTCEALTGLDADRRADNARSKQHQSELRGEIAQREQTISDLHAHLDAHEGEISRLNFELVGRMDDLRLWRRQHMMLHSFIESLTQSSQWKVQEPVRLMRRIVRPRGLDESALIPWHHLVKHPKSANQTWFSTGNDPHFIVPCYLPAGWLRLRLKMTSEVLGRAEIFFDSGRHSADNLAIDHDCVERFDVHGRVDRDTYFYLPRPALGIRFAPLDVPGQFHLETLQITPISPPIALWRAMTAKLGLLRQYGLLTRALGNGLGMLLCGDVKTFAQKLTGGLTYQKKAAATTTQTKLGEQVLGQAPPITDETRHQRRTLGFQRLDVVYVLKSAGICGGVKVVLEHVSRLHARGHNACIYFLDGSLDWFRWPVPNRKFASVEALEQALGEFRGIKVATWYETAPWVAKSLGASDRGYYLTQDIEESYCATPQAAAIALSTYRLGLQTITEGLWTREQLRQRFGLESVFVSIGLDFDLFQPRLVMRDSNLLLTQARTWSGGGEAGARLKGWDTAKDTILRTHDLNPRMQLATFSIEDKYPFPRSLNHVHHHSPTDEQLAEMYSRAGVYLLTSNHEGFGLTAAEAMACGCPVVGTRADGNEEFCIDGVTALTAPKGDNEQLARKIVMLQNDPKFARALAENARSFILSYNWDRTVDRLEREFLHKPGPEVLIMAPTRAARPDVDDFVEQERRDFRAVADREFGAEDSESIVAACDNLSGEYPDLQLAAKATTTFTLIIPTINDAELVTQCVRSCRCNTPSDVTVQYIVVDDGTRDLDVLQQLKQAADELDFELLCNHQNLGFSAAVNHGLRHAHGQYVVLCNNDIVFFRPWLKALEQAFIADPCLGVVGAKLLYPDGAIQHAGVDKVPGQLKWHHGYGKKPGDHPPANQSRYVWSVTGALYAIRRSALRRLGGLSTAYTTAYEDLDYSLHAWLNGIRVGYCCDVTAYHLEGGTRGATETKKCDWPLWAERERAGGSYFEKKWAFLRHVENFQALLSLHDRQPAWSGKHSDLRSMAPQGT